MRPARGHSLSPAGAIRGEDEAPMVRDHISESAMQEIQAFESLYRRFFPKIFNYVCYRVSDETVAEDLTAAIFEKALHKMSSLRSPEAFSAWLFRIAHNTVADYHRQVRHDHNVSLEALPATSLVTLGSDSPESRVIQQETFMRLQTHLRSLSEREQEIIALKFAGGLNNRQIGSIIGETPGNVGTILYRAIRKLRRKMIEEEGSDG